MLFLAARAGDRSAFSELYRRHQAMAWRVATVVVPDDDRAAMAVVEGMVSCVTARRPSEVPFRVRLVSAIREAARARSARLGEPGRERAGEFVDDLIDLRDPPTGDRMQADVSEDELCLRLAATSTTPPPELWAVVHVAWQDFAPPME